MANDRNHRPCLPLKPQEKSLPINILINSIICRQVTVNVYSCKGGISKILE